MKSDFSRDIYIEREYLWLSNNEMQIGDVKVQGFPLNPQNLYFNINFKINLRGINDDITSKNPDLLLC